MIISKVESGFNSSMILSEVKVFGVKQEPKYVTINDQSYNNFTFDDSNMVNFLLRVHLNLSALSLNCILFSTKQVLKIQYFYIDLNQFKMVNITWSS